MHRTSLASLIALCLCLPAIVRADDHDRDHDDATVVTNSPPSATATMTLGQDENGCAVWTVRGKVRPKFRGPGANVKLLCMKYNDLGNGGTGQVFPPSGECDGDFCPGENNVEANGNFTFQINRCDQSPRLDPSYFCVFVVHVDQAPSRGDGNGGNKPPPGGDPNGSAPCSGSFCPDI